MPDDACPTPDQLSEYLLGRIDDATSAVLDAHLLHCRTCQTALATTIPADDTFVSSLKSGLIQAEFEDEPALRVVIQQVSKHAFRSRCAEEAMEKHAAVPRPVATSESTQAGMRIGPYRLLKILGKGGMGQVYLAEHSRLEMTVAVKVLADQLSQNPQAIARFDREMKAVGRFNHPNIVRATDAGEFQGQHYLAMEFVDGRDLAQVVHACGPLKISDACEVIRQAAIGIQHAHEHALIHRDLKPSNLMVTRDGLVKVLDLGLARLRTKNDDGLTSDFQIMGTADYMAPEQALKSPEVDSRVDIYSLGCTLYALLCGRPPFADEKHSTSLRKIMAHEQEQATKAHERRTDIPIKLSEIIDKAMAKLPSDRFATAGDLAVALQPYAENANLPALYQATSYTGADTTKNTSDIGKHLALTDTAVLPKANPSLSPTLSKHRPRTFWIIAAILLPILGLALAGLALQFSTAKGTIIVEIEDDQISTSTIGEQLVIQDSKTGTVYRLSISGNTTQTDLLPGKYSIRVENPGTGLGLDTDVFELKRNGSAIVKASFRLNQPVAATPKTLDHRVAEAMIGHGARVHLKVGDGYQVAEINEELPQAEFRISRVEFRSSYELTDEDFESLANLKELSALDLCDVIISERVINYLIRIKSLSLLWLKYDQGPVTGLEKLVRLPTPYNLKLQGSAVGDAEVKAMSNLVRVRFLSLSGIGFTDECIPDIVKISEIAELSIDHSRVTGSGFKYLADLPRLESLQVPYSLVGDAPLKDLVTIKRLKKLNLAHTKITDNAVDALQTLTQLEWLRGDSRLTEEATENLRSKLPKCNVVMGH